LRIVAIMVGKAVLEAAQEECPVDQNRRRHREAQKSCPRERP
jgi:hypothetical protein